MYYINKRVGFSEIGPDCKIKLTDMLDYFQDAVIAQSEDLGVGVTKLLGQNQCWVLNSWQVIIDRYPHLGEKVLVGTAPYEFKSFMGSRNFIMKTENGEILARANSLWSFLDFGSMSLTRIPQEVMEAYTLVEKLDMEYAHRKIAVPEGMKEVERIIAKYHTLDSNNHVNNAQYISMAEDVCEEGRRCRQLRAEYRASAHAGDDISISLYKDIEAGVQTITLSDLEGKPYCIVEFS